MNNLKFRFVLYGIACLLCLFVAGYLARFNLPTKSILAEVKGRGHLRCGVNGKLPGFSEQKTAADKDGYYSDAAGFDADFCRAIAIAIFGTAEDKVKFKNLTTLIGDPNERFLALREGAVDVLLRNTSWTPGRDAEQGIDFGAIIFYTYQTFLVRSDSAIDNLDDLAGKEICVLPDTTTYDNLEILREKRGIPIELVTSWNGEEFKSTQDVANAFFRRPPNCDAFTSDYDQLQAHLSTASNPGDYRILDESISDEMLGPAVREDDSQWRDIVNYATWATMYAEQLGIGKKNVSTYGDSASFDIKVFLGIDDDRIFKQLGDKLGLPQDFAKRIIEELGNYEEIFQKNLKDILPARGMNQLWMLNHEGRLFAPAFVPDQIPTPAPAQ